MILPATGGAGRPILKPNEYVGDYSHDGKFLLYQTPVGGASDLGLLTVADGTTRRLTTTPEAESGARFTADGKTIVFRRTKTVERIHTVDLTTLLAAPRPEAR